MINIKINNHLYNYILDIIDTKTSAFKQITPKKPHKHISIVKFDNKAIEAIRLPKIFIHSDIFKMLPYNLQKKDNILTNYRKPRSINFRKAYFEIDQTLKTCTEIMKK